MVGHFFLLSVVENSTTSCITALLLEKEPTNLQAQSLSQLIEKAVTRGVFALHSSLHRH
ncbi:hypothetical protein Ac2012v2_003311 [Leucoagaricus gongylophorus]